MLIFRSLYSCLIWRCDLSPLLDPPLLDPPFLPLRSPSSWWGWVGVSWSVFLTGGHCPRGAQQSVSGAWCLVHWACHLSICKQEQKLHNTASTKVNCLNTASVQYFSADSRAWNSFFEFQSNLSLGQSDKLFISIAHICHCAVHFFITLQELLFSAL